ncbi:hypothetical protein QBC33DRAFT_497129 [Phialemonium atrogriseum]|uniref:Uncharacterized protein n=1 Tax=Phialemonium atrogriseum TaxID=1093897 RepID=A0AAJ0BWX1_9PEZI|nr:uncharacterized protein QBC33DRAFT_497129 [Phialemonium atrogriseum]KAK1764614.1 hypothetical protein QBC33DRAFT_497129 [Phialemonium atrogriseum]
MGTRHLICIFYKGKWVVAQYGQWDGYPEGQGFKLFRFLCVAHNIENLKVGLAHIYEPAESELDAINREIEDWEENAHQEMMANRMCEKNFPFPSLSRDTCAKILSLIADLGRDDGSEAESAEAGQAEPEKKKLPIQLSLEFANDALFCEWVYVVDLDTEVLEVYGGGERKHEGHRFKDVGAENAAVPRFWCSIPFKDLYLMSSESEFLDRVMAGKPVEEDEDEDGVEVAEGEDKGS